MFCLQRHLRRKKENISYLYDGFMRLQTYVPFLRAFLINELNVNAQVGYASGKV